MKKILALLLTIIMLISIMPVVGLGDTNEAELSRPLTLVASGTSTVSLNNCIDYGLQYASWTVLFATGTSSTANIYNFVPYTLDTTITLNDGDWVSFKGICNIPNENNHLKFILTGSIAANGNIMSLCGSNTDFSTLKEIDKPDMFASLFYDCTALTKAPLLPATTLTDCCYYCMFRGCSSLDKAPVLPAVKLATSCYLGMFMDCTSLNETPDLPATELADSCYSLMFSGCTSLTNASKLPATTLNNGCYQEMFSGCASLTEIPDLPATELANECYRSMFYGCASLTKAPDLPATELFNSCYESMFKGCTSLTNAPDLPATELFNSCYGSMFYGCTSLTEVPELPAMKLADGCYYSMFSGCTSLTEATELPATILFEDCYHEMFYGCASLTNLPDLPATIMKDRCYTGMFSYCTSLDVSKTEDLEHPLSWSIPYSETTKDIYMYWMFDDSSFPDGGWIVAGNTYYVKSLNYRVCTDDNVENGRLEVNTNKAKTTEKVNVKAIGNSGYEVDKVIITNRYCASETILVCNENNFTFDMPRTSVDITATFKKKTDSSAPISAPAEKTIPTVFVGEDKSEIKVIIKDNTYITESKTFSATAPIIIENDRTFLGIRDMAYALGIAPEAVKWDSKTKTASITKSGATISVTQDSKDITITYGGYVYTKTNDVSAINRNDRIYLPFRVIFEIFGYEVNWDNATRTITCK